MLRTNLKFGMWNAMPCCPVRELYGAQVVHETSHFSCFLVQTAYNGNQKNKSFRTTIVASYGFGGNRMDTKSVACDDDERQYLRL